MIRNNHLQPCQALNQKSAMASNGWKIGCEELISFFESKGHTFWKSSPVVPLDDPTLLFGSAGIFHISLPKNNDKRIF
ncbi:hypothetical protein SUGI_0810370 [Cryptomeria japonica]|nr:hypothetical protein SUGI_0810370 [Cryptomeria japonica]